MSNLRVTWKPWIRRLAVLAFLTSLTLLDGCAAKPRYAYGRALLRGEAATPAPAPDSLRAELELTAFAGKRKNTVSAALSALPYRRYKLDVFGLPGTLGASFLWSEARWTLVLYPEESYRTGEGHQVALENLAAFPGSVSVHDLFSFLWGDFFPGRGDSLAGVLLGGRSPAAPSVSTQPGVTEAGAPKVGAPEAGGHKGGATLVGYRAADISWKLDLDEATGLVRTAMRGDSLLRIEYRDYRAWKDRPLPGGVRVYSRNRLLLDIRVKRVEDDPKWRRDPFFIRIPKGYREWKSPAG